MPTIITADSGKLIRISPKDDRRLEYSSNKGITWHIYGGLHDFHFEELIEDDDQLLAVTDKGLYFSTNEGITWRLRHR